jgi:regulator of nonsense transcripts 2
MKSQQQAERAEQQRIKSLVLNYDLRETDNDGEDDFIYPLTQNTNAKSSKDIEKQHASTTHSHRGGPARRAQQARKLQLSDVDWYGRRGFPTNLRYPAKAPQTKR